VHVDRAAYGILVRLGDYGGMRLSELAGQLSLDLSTVSRQVRDLERNDLVAKSADPTDARATQLVLTRQGRAALKSIRRARHDLISEAVGDWSTADRERLAALLPRLTDGLRSILGG
jgi:DNA-binding MarR family transcriptional regulator